MKRLKNFKVLSIILLLFCSLLSGGVNAVLAANDFSVQVKTPVAEAVKIRQVTQQKADRWEQEKTRLQIEYEELERIQQNLWEERAELDKVVTAGRLAVTELAREIKEIERIENELTPFLEEVYDRLGALLETDLPFLRAERELRLAALRRTLDDPAIAIGEKYRKVMEALTVEAEYGDTIEVYQETIIFQKREVMVHIFRLGRIALFCQSPDRTQSGFFDVAAGSWQELAPNYNQTITAALEMGAKRRPMDILNLPVGKVASHE